MKRHPSEKVVIRRNGYRLPDHTHPPEPEPQMSTVRLLTILAIMLLLWLPIIAWIGKVAV